MSATIQLLGGMLLLSSLLAYACWTKIRVWMLREDLFAIRDRLWDRMRAEGMLDHPAHRSYRNALNALIRLAPAISWMMILTIVFERVELTPISMAREFDLEKLPTPVAEASRDAAHCVLRYLFFWTLLGLVLWIIFSILGQLRIWQSRLISAINRAFQSEEIRKLGRHFARV